MRVASGDDAQAPEGRCDARGACCQGQLISWRDRRSRVLQKLARRGVLDPLVHRQDRQVPGSTEPPVTVQGREVPHDGDRPVGREHDSLDVVGPGKREFVCRYPLDWCLSSNSASSPSNASKSVAMPWSLSGGERSAQGRRPPLSAPSRRPRTGVVAIHGPRERPRSASRCCTSASSGSALATRENSSHACERSPARSYRSASTYH